MKTRLLGLLLMVAFLGCKSSVDSESQPVNIALRVESSLPDSLFNVLFDSVVIKVSAADIMQINSKCNVDKSQKEISCNVLVPIGDKRTFELFVYDTSKTLAYYGKKADQSIQNSSEEIEILLYKLASDITIVGKITDSLILASTKYNWVWTNDSRGGGSQSSIRYDNDTVVIDSCYHVHFTELDSKYGKGVYKFKIKSRSFDFAWRITPADEKKGEALQIAYNMNVWPGKIKLIRSKWSVLSSFYYGWPDQTETYSELLDFTYDANQWHEIVVEDSGTSLKISFDGSDLDFFKNTSAQDFLSGLGDGYIGIGTTVSKTKIYNISVM